MARLKKIKNAIAAVGFVSLVACVGIDEDVSELGTTVQATVYPTWPGDYETGNTSQWSLGLDLGPPLSDPNLDCQGWERVQVGTSVPGPGLRQGGYAARFEVRGSCDFDQGGSFRVNRSEVSATVDQSDGYEGSEAYFGWSVYFPDTWEANFRTYDGATAVGITTFTQWKKYGGTCTAETQNIGFYAARDGYGGEEQIRMLVSGDDCTPDISDYSEYIIAPLGPSGRNRWHDFVLYVKWSQWSGYALTAVWHNGRRVLLHDLNGFHPDTYATSRPNLYDDGSPVRVKQGLYRFRDWPDAVVYHDAMRRRQSYEEAALPNPGFEYWSTTTSPRSWVRYGWAAFTHLLFVQMDVVSYPASCNGGGAGTYSLHIKAQHDATTDVLFRGVRQESGVKGTRVVPGYTYVLRADICSINPPATRGYRLGVAWFKEDGSPSATPGSFGSENNAGVAGMVFPRTSVTAPSDAAYGRVDVVAVSATPNDLVDFIVDTAGLWGSP